MPLLRFHLSSQPCHSDLPSLLTAFPSLWYFPLTPQLSIPLFLFPFHSYPSFLPIFHLSAPLPFPYISSTTASFSTRFFPILFPLSRPVYQISYTFSFPPFSLETHSLLFPLPPYSLTFPSPSPTSISRFSFYFSPLHSILLSPITYRSIPSGYKPTGEPARNISG